MNKIRPVNLKIQHLHSLDKYLLTITYRFGNNYTAKTFSFDTCLKVLIEQDKLVRKYPYLKRQTEIEDVN
jgi:hypothetical protein